MDDLILGFTNLAQLWGYGENMAPFLTLQIYAYYDNEPPLNRFSGNRDPLGYWQFLPDIETTEALRTMAIVILQIKPHGTSVEGLFSMWNYLKPPSRHNLSKHTHIRME
jgi:hypothetical protein